MVRLALWADATEGSWATIAAALILALLPLAFTAPLLYAVFSKVGAKGYSRRAVQSVGVWLTALSVALGGMILALFGHFSPTDAAVYRVAAAVFGLTSWSIGIVGTAFALRGLRETDKSRKHRRRRGHTYAVGGCTGNVVTLLALLIGGGWYVRNEWQASAPTATGGSLEAAAIFADAVRTAADALKTAPSLPPDTPSVVAPTNASAGAEPRDVAPPALVGGAATSSGGRLWFGTQFGGRPGDASPDPGPSTVADAPLNFRLERPGTGWLRVDPARAGPGAVAAYDLPSQKLRWIVGVERPGVERVPTLDAAVAAVQTRLRTVVPSFVFTGGESSEIGGVAGRGFSGSAQRGDEACSAQAWIGIHNGFVYELLVVGSGSPAESYADEARRLFGLFAPLDPSRAVHAPEVALPAEALELKNLGLDVRPLDATWTAWSDFNAEYADADYGARHDARTGFVVTAVRLDDAPVNPTAAAYALLSLVDQPYERAVARMPKRVSQDGLSGEEFGWTPPGEATSFRTARVFVGKRGAYLLLGWCDAEGSPRHEALLKALSQVRFTDVPSIAVVDLPTTIRGRSGRFFDALGKYFVGADLPASAEQQYRTALKFAPEAPAYLAGLADACFMRRREAEALAALDGYRELVARHDGLRRRHAEALAALGRRDEAIAVYAALFRDGYSNDEALARYAALLETAERWDEALATVTAYRRRRDTPAVFALEARVLGGRGDYFAAAKMLERRLSVSPAEAEPAFALADINRRLQRPTEALQVIDKLIAAGGVSAAAYYWKGLAEYDLRRTRSARDSFEQAHRLNPADAAAKQMLDYVTRLLGEAENLRIRTPIAAVTLPTSVVDAVPASPMPDEFGRAPAYYLDRTTAYGFVAGEDDRRTEYHTVRVLTPQGVAELNTLAVRFDPLSEEVFVNRLDVFDDAGRPTAVGDVATYYLVDDADREADRSRVLMLPVPGLRPGYRIELVATVRSFIKRTQFPFVQTYFGLQYPVRRQAVVVLSDPAQLAWSGTQADSVRRETGGVWWQAVDQPAIRRESFAPDPAETEPSLFVADKRNTWESVAQQYLTELRPLLEVKPIIQKTAQELTAGLDGNEAKLQALAEFVQREITYRPSAFGVRGRVPQSAEQTLSNRFGDGQDMSLLLAQLIASVGIVEARPALVNTRQPIQSKLATLDQFNHMVVFIPQGDSGRVIDAADKEADARPAVPLRLTGREALVIDDRHPRLVRLPRAGLDSYRAEIVRQVRFDDRGTASVAETIAFFDYYAAAMRGRLRAVPPDDRADFWQRLLREAGTPVVMRTWQVEKLDDLTAPLTVTAEYEVERALTALGAEKSRQWAGTVPAAFEATLLSAPATESRRMPLDFPYALRLSSSIDVESPPGFALSSEKDLFAHADSDLLTAQRTGNDDQGRLRIAFQLTRPAGRHAPSRYDEYRRALQQARITAAPAVRFTTPQSDEPKQTK